MNTLSFNLSIIVLTNYLSIRLNIIMYTRALGKIIQMTTVRFLTL